MSKADLARELERRIEALGFELVEMEEAGSARRPILRLRVDRPDPESGGVTLDDCVTVSRALESYLDEARPVGERYVLEVSSPGVERPLVRHRDYERFAGREVALRGKSALAGRTKRLEGELLGLRGEPPHVRAALRLPDGEEVEVPLAEIDRAQLIHRWGGAGRDPERGRPQIRGERRGSSP